MDELGFCSLVEAGPSTIVAVCDNDGGGCDRGGGCDNCQSGCEDDCDGTAG